MLDISGQNTPTVSTTSPSMTTPVNGVHSSPTPPLAKGGAIPSVSDSSSKALLVVVFSLVALVVIAGGFLSYVQADTKSKITTLDRNVKKLREDLAKPERVTIEKQANQFSLAVKSLQKFTAIPSPWTGFLKELTNRVPAEVALTNLSVDEKNIIRLNGTTNNYQNVAKFLASLKASDQFKAIELESSSVNQSETGVTVSFAVRAEFATTTDLETRN